MRDRTKEYRDLIKTVSLERSIDRHDDCETKTVGRNEGGSKRTEGRAEDAAERTAEMLLRNIMSLEKFIRSKRISDRKDVSRVMHDLKKFSATVERVERILQKKRISPRTGSDGDDALGHREGIILVLYGLLRKATQSFQIVQREHCRYTRIVAQSKRGSETCSALLVDLPEKFPGRDATEIVETKNSRFVRRPIASKDDDITIAPSVLSRDDARLMEMENEDLARELTTQLDDVREMQSKLREIAKVCTFLNSKVQEQHWQVEQLNESAMKTTEIMKKSRDELTEAVRNKGSSRKLILWFFLILSLSLLFLDWYQP